MTQTERDNIIKQGVQTRRNTYRGKDITEYYQNGKLFDMIESGKFDDIYVGDYIVSEHKDAFGGKIVWLIADLDNYWNQGDNPLTKHHATIIPSYKLEDSQMNSKNADKDTTEGGYVGSEMYRTILNEVYSKYIKPDFCKIDSDCHIIDYRNFVTNAIDSTRLNQWGLATGASSDCSWESRKLDLMSEVNVFGTTVWSSSGYDVGIDNRQYAIFQLRPELINQGVSGILETNSERYWYWLKAITSSSNFTYVTNDGYSRPGRASSSFGVRPRFLID